MTDTTHEAPERMKEYPAHRTITWLDDETGEEFGKAEYVRADLVQAAVAAALTEAAAHIAPHPDHDRSDWTEYAHEAYRHSRSILALIDPDAQAALDRVANAEKFFGEFVRKDPDR
jgi:acyl-CoA reductase-like NAD-dependent aldehyde dehydrogenase